MRKLQAAADLHAVAAIAVARFASQARSPATLRAYNSDWWDFAEWCAANGLNSLPATPNTVAQYLAFRASTLKPATLERRLSAVLIKHRAAGHSSALRRADPAIADVLRGIRRSLGTAPTQKAPITLGMLAQMVAATPRSPKGIRDRAVLLLGWAGAFRRSELAALTVADLNFNPRGLVVQIRQSKEDQEGEGSIKAIPHGKNPELCPVRAMKRWLQSAGHSDPASPVFLRVDRHGRVQSIGISGEAVGEIVKEAATRLGHQLGWSKSETKEQVAMLGGHSLRAGLITSAALAGATELQIMNLSNHKSARTVRRYVRAGAMLGAVVLRRVGL